MVDLVIASRVELCGLSKRYRGEWAVKDLSFTAEPGRITGFLGPNVAGKTTTLRLLAGLIQPTAGTASIGGLGYRSINRPATVVGIVMELGGFYSGCSAHQYLSLITKAAGIPRSRVDAVLEAVELADVAKKAIKSFSLGMRQRVQLAAALLGDPPVLLLDEPMNGLDPQGIAWMRSFLRSAASDGRTVLISSHLLTEVAKSVDDVVVISGGHLVAWDTVERLTAGTKQTVRISTHHPLPLESALRAIGVEMRNVESDIYICEGADSTQISHTASQVGVELSELTTLEASLEDIFLALTADGKGRFGR